MIQLKVMTTNNLANSSMPDSIEEASEWTEVLMDRLRQARERKGISQPRAANLIGIDSNTLWRWENGYVKKIPISGLRNLSIVYDVSLCWLLGQKDAPSPDEVELLRMYRAARPEFRRATLASLREATSPLNQDL